MVHILSNIFVHPKQNASLYKTDNMDIGRSTSCKAIGAFQQKQCILYALIE